MAQPDTEPQARHVPRGGLVAFFRPVSVTPRGWCGPRAPVYNPGTLPAGEEWGRAVRREWKGVLVTTGALALTGWFAVPAAGSGDAEEAPTGCVPSDSSTGPELVGVPGEGLEASVEFFMPSLEYPSSVSRGLGAPAQIRDSSAGTLTLTLEALTGERDEERWTDLDNLGFDVTAMDQDDPEPIEVELNVTASRIVDTSTGVGKLTPGSATLRHTEWDRAYGAYGVVAAEVSFHNDDGESFCTVEFPGSAEEPVATFDVTPEQSEIDDAIGELGDERGTTEKEAPVSPLVVSAVLLAAAVLAVLGMVGVEIFRRRNNFHARVTRKPGSTSSGDNGNGHAGARGEQQRTGEQSDR